MDRGSKNAAGFLFFFLVLSVQDLVFLDSESIFVMPSAFNDDVQFGLQVGQGHL